MAEIIKEFGDIPIEWLEDNYPDIKEELGFGLSDDRVNTHTDKALTDEEVLRLQKECIKRFKEEDGE